MKVICKVGSSTLISGKALGLGLSPQAMVSPILTPLKPATATMSPAVAVLISRRLRP